MVSKCYIFKIFFILVALTTANTSFSQLVWTQQNSGTTTQFIDEVEFLNASVGYTLMYPDKVLSTTDGGNTWNPTTIPGSSLNGLSFVDTQTGWVIDYVSASIYKTTNGGSTWQTVYSNPFFTSNAYDVHFVDANNGWAVRSDYFLHTSNGGVTWDSIASPGGYDFVFTDLLNGFVLWGNYLNVSTNGGITWSLNTIWTGAENVNGFCALDASNLWAVGDNGLILQSTNGGISWSTNSIGVYNDLRGILFFDMNNGVAVGPSGYIITTADGGATWTLNSSGVTTDLYQLDMVSPGEAWVTGASGAIISSFAYTDITFEYYDGNSSVCAGSNEAIDLAVKNHGSSPITLGSFSLTGTAGSTLNYSWNGLVNPGAVEIVSIGSLVIDQTEAFTVTFSGDADSSNNTYDFTIDVIGDPVTFSGPHLICDTDSVTIYASGGLYYNWTDFTTTGYDSSVTFTPTTTAYYAVSVEDSYGCLTYDSIKVELDFTCGDTLITDSLIINDTNIALTPNNDNKNDYLVLDGIDNTENIVVIYNRWGDVIVTIINYNNEDNYWDCTFPNGSIVAEGTYFFTLEIPSSNDSSSGWLQVIR